jgi:ribonuclease BN (tRNA processing enzyme)
MAISITILGSASGLPSSERNDSGYILEHDGRLALFDCGSGVRAAFIKAAFDPVMLEAIFISHMHPDHISDLPVFIQMLYHSDRIEPLAIYLPEEAVRPMKKYLNACYLLDEKLPFKLELKAIKNQVKIFDKKALVKPIANQHLTTPGNVDIIEASGYPNRMESYSFLIQSGDKKLLYSADLATFEEIENYLDDLDLLLIETTHIDINRLPDVIEERRIKKTVLSHIADEENGGIREFADSHGAGADIVVAEDNLTIKI